MQSIRKYSKAIAAVLSALGVIASSGVLTGQAETILNSVIAVAGAVAVYLIPNTSNVTPPAAAPVTVYGEGVAPTTPAAWSDAKVPPVTPAAPPAPAAPVVPPTTPPAA